jgi:glycerate 2-kinase
MADRQLRVLIAPDSFKGSLSSVVVAHALADGWHRARPGDDLHLAPLADGGEGTLIAIEAAGGWQWREAQATDPLGRPIQARWLRRADGRAAVVEMAAASGLSLVAASERDAARATSEGTGDLLRAVLDEGIRDIALGIGGSATTDGGAGLLRSLGAEVSDDLSAVDLDHLDSRLAETRLRIACDVTNPLLGPTGAAGRRERDTPGAGAAGGVGFAMLALAGQFAELELRPGVDLVMEEAGFDRALAASQLVITGEGRIDAQTAFGKTALGVAKRAQAAGRPCIAVGGGVTPEGIEALAAVGAIAVPLVETPQELETAMTAGPGPVERCGERLARLFGAALTLPTAHHLS